MRRLTLWKLTTGAVAASLMVTTLASAVQISGGPIAWHPPICPYHPPVVYIIGCESGSLTIPEGIREFFLVIHYAGEPWRPGCPRLVEAGAVTANIYGRRRSAKNALVATVQGSFHINRLVDYRPRTVRIKWLQGLSRSGDEGVLRFGGVSCPILVQ